MPTTADFSLLRFQWLLAHIGENYCQYLELLKDQRESRIALSSSRFGCLPPKKLILLKTLRAPNYSSGRVAKYRAAGAVAGEPLHPLRRVSQKMPGRRLAVASRSTFKL